MRSLIRFGKQRPPKDSDNEDEQGLLYSEPGRASRQESEPDSPISRAGSQSSVNSNPDSNLENLADKNKRISK